MPIGQCLGTHYLRGKNNTHQPWSSRRCREHFSLLPHNPTEEGLASLHTVLMRPEPLLFRNALLYYAIVLAATLSFKDLFSKLAEFVSDPEKRWEYCVRAKRGQYDTSVPGTVYPVSLMSPLSETIFENFHTVLMVYIYCNG